MEYLDRMSSGELRELAKMALRMAEDLEKEQPTYELALASGVKVVSFTHSSFGFVPSYTGRAYIYMENGSVWKAEGYTTEIEYGEIVREGYIRFTKVQ